MKAPLTTLGVGLAAAIWLVVWLPDPAWCVPFAGGMAVAMLMRVPRAAAVLRHRAAALAAMLAMAAAILLFRTIYAPLPLLLAFALAVVACGNAGARRLSFNRGRAAVSAPGARCRAGCAPPRWSPARG